MLSQMTEFHSLLRLNIIPFYMLTIFYLSIHQLMDTLKCFVNVSLFKPYGARVNGFTTEEGIKLL
jgi:hypothetical protein